MSRVRRASAERNMQKVLAYFLVALDKVRKVWYSVFEVHNERTYHEVRLLVDIVSDGILIGRKDDTMMALVPTDASGHKGACYLQYSGIMLLPQEYEFVIDDAEFDKLLER